MLYTECVISFPPSLPSFPPSFGGPDLPPSLPGLSYSAPARVSLPVTGFHKTITWGGFFMLNHGHAVWVPPITIVVA